ncbi:hypothetical protein Trydic_g14097 [Trypoxylus dichotomus]
MDGDGKGVQREEERRRRIDANSGNRYVNVPGVTRIVGWRREAESADCGGGGGGSTGERESLNPPSQFPDANVIP